MSTPEDEVHDDVQVVAEEVEEVMIDPEIVGLRAEIRELRSKMEETAARLRAVSKAYTEQKAEMTAFRERVKGQTEVRLARKEFEVARGFLEPVQNLKRSLEVEGVEALPEGFTAGLRGVYQQFREALGQLGLEAVPGVGSPFDPNLHEALAMMPVTDEEDDGRVLVVHVDGYMVNGRALQPAKVVVGKYTPGEEAAQA